MTEQRPYGFSVEQDADGTPRILLEPIGESLPVLQNGLLSFELREDITLEEAQELADTLNEQITDLTYAVSRTA